VAQNAAMMIGTTGRVRLPIAFDARALLDDAQALPPEAWEPHFNRALYRNDWSGVALRSNGGAGLYPNPHAGQAFADTPWLERCPAVRTALARFACRTTAVRFLRVGSDSEIFEHRDYDLTADGGEARALSQRRRAAPERNFNQRGPRSAKHFGEKAADFDSAMRWQRHEAGGARCRAPFDQRII